MTFLFVFDYNRSRRKKLIKLIDEQTTKNQLANQITANTIVRAFCVRISNVIKRRVNSYVSDQLCLKSIYRGVRARNTLNILTTPVIFDNTVDIIIFKSKTLAEVLR